jgi:hypothetical protein
VVTHRDAVFVCAEDGRAINGLDISGFIDNLPGKADARRFWTQNASGSTSQAASIIEATLSGAKLLLIDEDSSATNFLIKDYNMRKLIPNDPITPLFDRVQELHTKLDVSTLIVVGGSSEYLGVAEHVIAMQDFLPVFMTDRVSDMILPEPEKTDNALVPSDKRRLLSDNFNPSYHAKRLGKTITIRIKPLRLQEKVLEYGDEQLDLKNLKALVDPHQVLAIGYALLLARNELMDWSLSPSQLAEALSERIKQGGLQILTQDGKFPLFLALPRRLELAGAINRFRRLNMEII